DGLNVGDEIVAIDQVRVGDDLNRLLVGRPVGDTLNLLVNRGGLLRRINVTLGANPLVSYRLEPISSPSDAQKSLYRKWLYIN
ncbi:MAG: PDZ domain-containing protein, partial [Cytophagaceae bacterium]